MAKRIKYFKIINLGAYASIGDEFDYGDISEITDFRIGILSCIHCKYKGEKVILETNAPLVVIYQEESIKGEIGED